jgi:hypothetical protein
MVGRSRIPRRQKRPCPSEDCSHPHPAQMDPGKMLAAAGVTADWVNTAKRCCYCGCVHTPRGDGGGEIKGWIGSYVLGDGWMPKR